MSTLSIRKSLPGLTLVAILLIPIVAQSPYWRQVGALALVYAIAVLGYNIMLGEAGLLSLGHAAFMGAGAYSYSILADQGLSPLGAVPGALVVSGGLALAVGALTLRFQHAYFAIATFAVAEVARNFLVEWRGVSGGVFGISVEPLELLGVRIYGAQSAYGAGVVLLIVSILLHERVRRASVGRAMRGVRDDELMAEAMGLQVFRVKLSSFVVGSLFAACAGILYGLMLTHVDPNFLSVEASVLILAMLIVGGMGSWWGAVIGAIFVSVVPELVRFLDRGWEMVYGLVLVAAVLAGRGGIVGASRYIRRRMARSVPSQVDDPNGPEDGGASIPDDKVISRLLPAPAQKSDLMVTELSKSFEGLRAVDGVTLSVKAGAVEAVIGPNGSGKSTLVNVITGLYQPDAGAIVLGDQDLTGLRPDRIARSGVVRTFQHSRTFTEVSVEDNILPIVEIKVAPGRPARDRTRELLQLAGLQDYAAYPVTRLPHGHRRLLEIVRALALRPSVICLDEPAAGLSAKESEGLKRLIMRMSKAGLGIVLIEHNMPFVMSVATQLTVLEQGRVIARGSPDDVVRDEAVRRAYLGEAAESPGVSAPEAGAHHA